MLYANAQFLALLALAYRRSGQKLFLQRAQETFDWLIREMSTPEGAFCASLDADSEGKEGKFYVWSRAEIDAVLGPRDGEYFAECYDVTRSGNFEVVNILSRLNHLGGSSRGPNEFGAGLQRDDLAASETRLAALRHKLLAAREQRIRPGLDDKALADWNGLMIAALANAGAMLHQPSWLAQAQAAFAFFARHMTRGDRLGHSWRDGRLLYPGLASDHAAMVKAALALHEATGAPEYLAPASQWQRAPNPPYIPPHTSSHYLPPD